MSYTAEQDLKQRDQLDEGDFFRADAYALLSSLLAQPPSQDLLNWLQQVDIDESNDQAMREAWTSLQKAAQDADKALLDEEYQNLFIGVGRGELLPYGSWYMSGFLMEKPLLELRHDLARLGFEREPDVKEPEDHIAALMQVMALLILPGDGRQSSQQQFFNKHLGGWSQRFFHDLTQSPTAQFYRAVGRFGELFSGQEKLLLEARVA